MQIRIWLSIICILAATITAKAEPAARIDGWLHTDGPRILDERGRDVVFRGVNVSGLEWGVGQPWRDGKCPTKEYGCWAEIQRDNEFEDIAAWGFNMVRLPVAWANLEPTSPTRAKDGSLHHQWNEEYLAVVDRVIERYRDIHVAVVISMHQWAWSPAMKAPPPSIKAGMHGLGLPVWLYLHRAISKRDAEQEFFSHTDKQDMLIDVWRMLARRYSKDSTVVGADMFNEPGLVGPPIPIDDFFQRTAAALHAENPHLLLIFEDSGATPVTRRPEFANAVYSFHVYKTKWLSYTQEHLDKARRWNLPAWVGEFQTYGPKDQPDGRDGFVAMTKPFLAFLKARKLGWSYWAYERAARSLGGEGGRGPINAAAVKLLREAF